MSSAVHPLLAFGPFVIDPEERQLLRDDQPIPLSPKAFELLLVLAQRSGQVVQKDELMRLLWPDTFVEESNLGQHIFQLRKALGETAHAPAYIVTVPGRGYRFAQKVSALPAREDREIVLESRSRSLVVVEEESRTGREHVQKAKSVRILLVASATAILLILAAVLLLPALYSPTVLSVRQITHSGQIEPYGKVLSDGVRLYFNERKGGADVLAQAPAAGGEPVPLDVSLPSAMVYDIDPGKSNLLVGTTGTNADQTLWVAPTAGGSARQVDDLLASEGTGWSSDGGSIFFSQDAEIYRVNSDGENPVKLLTAPGYVISLRASPDGKLLRFTVLDTDSGINSLWQAAADGSNPHRLLPGWKTSTGPWGDGESCGDWTPDGRYFVFRSVHDGVASFWAIREKGSWLQTHLARPVQLYASPDHLGDPRFSPDGKKIFFVNYQEQRELVRYDKTQHIFVPYLGGIPARLLSFSKDGRWVAYRNETDGTLWRSRVDGSRKLQLTFPPMIASHSSWSPNGKRIVFGGRLPGKTGRLYEVPFNGGTPELLEASDASDSQPDWSPDGRSVVFERWVTGEDGIRHSSIHVFNLATRRTTMIPGGTDFDGVHWSPDGKYVAASDQTNHKLMLFDLKRQQWSDLAGGGTPYGWGIRWSSDSQYVYYQLPDEGEEQPMFRVRVADRKVEQITSARQILRADVLGYSMTGLTPDGSPVASLIRRNSDIYVLELKLP